ncbi:MAG: hypothetical protein AAF669_09175 [Pseudomonadota bacterium]
MALNVRLTSVQLIWDGKDVTRDLSRYVKELRFTDRFASGKAQRDDIAIRLSNVDERFTGAWWPATGSQLQPAITWQDDAGSHTWRLGTFTIDQQVLRRMPNSLTVQALSQSLQRKALEQVQTRSWEQITLAALAQQVASESGLTTQISDADINLTNLQQRQESAHALLGRLAQAHHLVFAIKGTVLVLAAKPVVKTHVIDWRTDVISGDIKKRDRALYAACTIQYYDAQQDVLLDHTESVTGVAGDRTLNLYTPATDLANARELAQAALAEANQAGAGQAQVVIRGAPIAAGEQINLQHAGRLSGTFVVREAIHTLNPAWTTHLGMERQDG